MKTNKTYKIITILLFISALTTNNTYSQDSYINRRWNIKAGYARYKTGTMTGRKVETTGNYRLEINYGFLKFFETGIYIGSSRFDYLSQLDTSSYIPVYYFAPFYGVNLNFHGLPFLIKAENFRFDLYLTGKYGGLFLKRMRTGKQYHEIEYAMGIGLCFYPWNHVGLFIEYCYGNYLFEDSFSNDHTKFRYGLTFKFK